MNGEVTARLEMHPLFQANISSFPQCSTFSWWNRGGVGAYRGRRGWGPSTENPELPKVPSSKFGSNVALQAVPPAENYTFLISAFMAHSTSLLFHFSSHNVTFLRSKQQGSLRFVIWLRVFRPGTTFVVDRVSNVEETIWPEYKICVYTHTKELQTHVKNRWIMDTLKNPACTTETYGEQCYIKAVNQSVS